MRIAKLETETDFAGWRSAARGLRAEGVPPEELLWTVDGDNCLFGAETIPIVAGSDAQFRVPREFVEVAEQVVLHRSPERFALLYRLLWRLKKEPYLMHVASDPDVARANDFCKAVSRASHKMKAFTRFRLVEAAAMETYVAWYEPPHRVAEACAPWFVRRFTNMRFSVLTPDICIHWDREKLGISPGADPADAPKEDALEEYWRTYYASIFNPARLKTKAMQKEMPKFYWRSLPEAALIPDLIRSAEGRTHAMVSQAPSEPSRRVVRQAQRLSRDGSYEEGAPNTLEEVVAGVDFCRRCDLWKDSTQGVTGEGPQAAKLMFVGEQPGDQEDLTGQPFVGPAGQVFNRALAEAGVPRSETYVTNAVKHFKHEQRGKRRLHKTPDTREVEACRWWLDAERRVVRPLVIVSLGATAAQAVFGKAMPVTKSRGQAFPLSNQAQGVVTFHPSYLLRLPDEAAKAKAYAEFVSDLKAAWDLVG